MADTPAKKAAPKTAKTPAAKKAAKGAQKAPANRWVTHVSNLHAGRPFAVKTPRTQPAPSPYDVVLHPIVTEKMMFNMDKNNSLEFLVVPRATKPEIKAAVEELFEVKVRKVTTRHSREGKRAIVRFAEGYSAEDVGTRIGVF